jgi:alpha-1,2-mannosyltransferase
MLFYLSPLAAMNRGHAAELWLVLSVLAAVIAMAASTRLALAICGRLGAGQRRAFVALAVLLLWILPFGNNLRTGQVNLFVLALASVSLLLGLVFERDFEAGLLLAPAVLLKVTPLALLLFLVVNRRPRALYGFSAGAILLAAPSFLAGKGLAAWRNFFDFSGSLAYGKTVPGLFPASSLPNFSVAGFVARLLPAEAGVLPVTILLLAGLGVGLLFRHFRVAPGRSRESLLVCYLVLMVVGSPLAYLHHVVYVYPGLLLAAGLLMTEGNARSHALLALLVGLAAFFSTDFPLLYGRLSIHLDPLRSLNLYALLLLFSLGLLLPRLAEAR